MDEILRRLVALEKEAGDLLQSLPGSARAFAPTLYHRAVRLRADLGIVRGLVFLRDQAEKEARDNG